MIVGYIVFGFGNYHEAEIAQGLYIPSVTID
jgi:hypothetical protein